VDTDTLETISRYSFQLEELKHALNNGSPKNKAKILELSNAVIEEKDVEKVSALQKEILELKEKEASAMPLEKKQLIYTHLYEGLHYTALMLNLVALERVFATETNRVLKHNPTARRSFYQDEVVKTKIPEDLRKMVSSKIESVSDYRASKILPFTLINAERMVKTAHFKKSIANVLISCAHESFAIPKETEILIGVDTSGSMTSMLNDSLRIVDAASFLGALIISSHSNTTICAVADICKKVKLSNEDNLFQIAEKISLTDVGHGTMLEQIMSEYKGQKYLLLLTDSVAADNLESKWLKTKKPEGAKLIVWQLQDYQTRLSKHPSVIYFAGFSDKLLELLKHIIEETKTQLEEIEKVIL
jgi:60 kDa SS-A/Ro ribonucleoprotein